MYPEFIAIYIGLGILFVLSVVTMVLVILLFKRGDRKPKPHYYSSNQMGQAPVQGGNMSMGGNIVLCTRCATEFSSSMRNCPNCGAPR